jgi:hypothetical protein
MNTQIAYLTHRNHPVFVLEYADDNGNVYAELTTVTGIDYHQLFTRSPEEMADLLSAYGRLEPDDSDGAVVGWRTENGVKTFVYGSQEMPELASPMRDQEFTVKLIEVGKYV